SRDRRNRREFRRHSPRAGRRGGVPDLASPCDDPARSSLGLGTLRPLYVDGTITAEAAALRSDLDLPRLPPFPPEVLAAAGLLDRDISAICNVLAAYDRTNAMALIALSTLLLRLDDEPLTRHAASSHGEAPRERPSPGVAQHASKRLRDVAARARN
ncbi:MAG TPA: hypothetical protein VHT00_11250, partial [Stellaceae bacterium]|nr:hypothetical protein [Stellaceae bacterium]